MIRSIVIIIIALAIGSCGNNRSDNSRKELTGKQRDSVLAESGLPGSGAVGKAMEVSDSASARKEKLDELDR